MNPVVAHIKWIMLISGLLTCTMVYAALAPQAAMMATFGEDLQSPAALLVVRNWGVLITMVGLLLVYGAFNPPARGIAATFAGASKLAFVLLVLANGSKYLGFQVGVAVAVDAIWVVLLAIYLATCGSAKSA